MSEEEEEDTGFGGADEDEEDGDGFGELDEDEEDGDGFGDGGDEDDEDGGGFDSVETAAKEQKDVAKLETVKVKDDTLFPNFSKKYFQNGNTGSYQLEPIKLPLLKIPQSMVKPAAEVFVHICRWCGITAKVGAALRRVFCAAAPKRSSGTSAWTLSPSRAPSPAGDRAGTATHFCVARTCPVSARARARRALMLAHGTG